MTKTEIMNVINESNTNKEIKWRVAKNTAVEIILTNSYDTAVKFSIRLKRCDSDEWITVRDEHMDKQVAMLFKGDAIDDDYKTNNEGIVIAVKAAVRRFNHTY